MEWRQAEPSGSGMIWVEKVSGLMGAGVNPDTVMSVAVLMEDAGKQVAVLVVGAGTAQPAWVAGVDTVGLPWAEVVVVLPEHLVLEAEEVQAPVGSHSIGRYFYQHHCYLYKLDKRPLDITRKELEPGYLKAFCSHTNNPKAFEATRE